MNRKRLITKLRNQHRALGESLLRVIESSKSTDKDRSKQILLELEKFKEDLMEHLKLENEIFYPDYKNLKIKAGQDVEEIVEFDIQMKAIGEVVLAFLDKYNSVNSIELSIGEFRKELQSVTDTLNTRIETEEEGMFDMYLLM